jgi:hypothetical protein
MIKKEKDRQLMEGHQLDALLEELHGNLEFWNIMNRSFHVDEKRWEILRGILIGFSVQRREELLNEAYRYGSMLKREDLLGRQVFLWLLGILEDNRKQLGMTK